MELEQYSKKLGMNKSEWLSKVITDTSDNVKLNVLKKELKEILKLRYKDIIY